MSFDRPPLTPDSLWQFLSPRPSEPNPFCHAAAALIQGQAWGALLNALSQWDAVVTLGDVAFRTVNIAEARSGLAATLAGFVALVRAAVAAKRGEPDTPLRDAATRHFASAWPEASVEDLVEAAFATLHGTHLPTAHTVQVPVLFAVGRVGRVGLLHLERSLGPGTVCHFAPHLARLGFQPFDAAFRESVRRAWELVRSEFPPGSRVRWWLTVGEAGDIRGDSAGAAFAAGLFGLAGGLRFARVGVTGSLESDGRVGRVGGHLAKAAALPPDGVTRFLTGRGDRAAADLVRLFYPRIAVHEIDTYRDAVPLLCGDADAATAYLTACRRGWASDPWSARDNPDVFLGPEFVPPSVQDGRESHAWTAARQHFPSAALLGGPGAGKSTLLRYEGWLTATEQLKALAAGALPQELLVPVLVSAAALATRTHESFQSALAEAASVPRELLQRDRVQLLLDGWDELSATQLDELLRWLRANRPRRLYLAARHAGAAGAVEAVGTTRLELVEWTPEQGWQFARGRFTEPERFAAFAETVRRSPDVLRVPLLAALACRAFARHGLVPQTPAELLAECLDGLFGIWPSARGGKPVRDLTDTEALTAFERREAAARLAWELADANPARNSFGLPALRTAANAAKLAEGTLDDLIHRSGLLVRVRESPLLYAFPHRPLRDFLLAWALARGDWRAAVAARLYHPPWGDVLALVGGALRRQDLEDDPDRRGRADDFLRFLVEQIRGDALLRPLLIAGRAAAELPDSPHRKRLAHILVDAYLSPDCPVPREELVGALVGLGNDSAAVLAEVVRYNPNARRDPWDDLARRTREEPPCEAEVWGAVNVRLVLSRLGSAGRAAGELLAAEADAEVAAFAFRLFPTGPVPVRVVERAIQLLTSPHSPAVRRAAAELLAVAPSPQLLQQLLASPEPDDTVERRLVAALAATLHAAPDRLPPLLAHAPSPRLLMALELAFHTTPPMGWVAACLACPTPRIRLLGLKACADQPELFDVVAQLAVADPEPTVQSAALEVLPTFGEAALPLLRERAPTNLVAACGLARLDPAFADVEADRLLAHSPTPSDLVRHGVYRPERIREAVLRRVLTDPTESLCELARQLAAFDAAALTAWGDHLAERLRQRKANELGDLLDAAWVCLDRSRLRSQSLLRELQLLAADAPFVYDVLRSLEPLPEEPADDAPPVPPTTDLRTLLANLDGTDNRYEIVAALWRVAAGTPVPLDAVPSGVRALIDSLRRTLE